VIAEQTATPVALFAGLVELTVGGVVSAAATVKELVETLSSPWLGLPGSGIHAVPAAPNVALPVSYWFPYQAAFHVYVPGVAGAGALSVRGHTGAFTGPPPLEGVPVLTATCTPFWSYRMARAWLARYPPLMVTLTVSPGAYVDLFVAAVTLIPVFELEACTPCAWHIPQ
jgi:hypothetical protein